MLQQQESTNNTSCERLTKTNEFVKRIIRDNTHSNGYVDIKKIAERLKITVTKERFISSTVVAVMKGSKSGRATNIYLSDRFSDQELNCAMAWVIATYFIDDTRLASRFIECNIFELRGFREHRYSRIMLLATRLMISEATINKLDALDNYQTLLSLKPFMTQEFIGSVIKGHSVSFLLDNQFI